MKALAARWREEADAYACDGATAQAAVLRRVADELDATLAQQDAELLPLARAAEVSGYSVAHLRRLIGQHRLRNLGTPRDVQVRRGDLPRKPGRPPNSLGPDLVGARLHLPGRVAKVVTPQ